MVSRRYCMGWADREGGRIARLRDDNEQAEADVAVSFGMNVVRFVSRGQEVVLQPPSFEELRRAPFRYGIPVLSPPGRTSYGRLPHRGKVYQLPTGQGKHHMHGELGTLPWQAEAWGADEEQGAFIEARYAYKDDPERFGYFPFELQYIVTIRLKDGRLSLEGSVRNGGADAAPFSLGYHPYFVCDLSRTTLRVPASSEWPRDSEGGTRALPGKTRLAAALRDGLKPSELAERLYFLQCGPASADRGDDYVCQLVDSGSGRRVHFQVDGLFAVMVLFVPTWGEAISLEPHSCVPDAVNLPWDASLTGMLELAPGGMRRFGWAMQCLYDDVNK